jgi:regulator of RNase E activity RraA
MAEYNTKVTIGGVEVSPGDIIFADINGVVAIPEKEVGRVVELLHQSLDHENKTMSGLRKGESAKELYSVYKAF